MRRRSPPSRSSVSSRTATRRSPHGSECPWAQYRSPASNAARNKIMIGTSTSTCPRRLVWIAVIILLTASGRTPARADGGVVEGTFTLLNSGDSAEKIDLVFLGDGFTSAEQDKFNGRVDDAVTAF